VMRLVELGNSFDAVITRCAIDEGSFDPLLRYRDEPRRCPVSSSTFARGSEFFSRITTVAKGVIARRILCVVERSSRCVGLTRDGTCRLPLQSAHEASRPISFMTQDDNTAGSWLVEFGDQGRFVLSAQATFSFCNLTVQPWSLGQFQRGLRMERNGDINRMTAFATTKRLE